MRRGLRRPITGQHGDAVPTRSRTIPASPLLAVHFFQAILDWQLSPELSALKRRTLQALNLSLIHI